MDGWASSRTGARRLGCVVVLVAVLVCERGSTTKRKGTRVKQVRNMTFAVNSDLRAFQRENFSERTMLEKGKQSPQI
jgi:hypothetical protein